MTGSYTLVFVWVGFIALVGQYGNVYQTVLAFLSFLTSFNHTAKVIIA